MKRADGTGAAGCGGNACKNAAPPSDSGISTLLRRGEPAGTSDQRVIALAGNPNVGKSTVFNALTGMHQHTGNWPGKTVSYALGRFLFRDCTYTLVDLPGLYSLHARSAEETVARDFLTSGGSQAVICVCDAACLERNLHLVLQILEITPHVILCLNLMDEAEKKGVTVDATALSYRLGIPVIQTAARSGQGLDRLCETLHRVTHEPAIPPRNTLRYGAAAEEAAALAAYHLAPAMQRPALLRWLSLRIAEGSISRAEDAAHLLTGNTAVPAETIPTEKSGEHAQQSPKNRRRRPCRTLPSAGYDAAGHMPVKFRKTAVSPAAPQAAADFSGAFDNACEAVEAWLSEHGVSHRSISDDIVSCAVTAASEIAAQCVRTVHTGQHPRDRLLDRLFTGRFTAFPIMLLLLGLIFWITICGANLISDRLGDWLFRLEDWMYGTAAAAGWPGWLSGVLIRGMYRITAWVVSVMLPPMAIFFPLFTLLEDFGYLPRVAFNLDRCFQRCGGSGKQSLTMCMGLGCNAAGVSGCRIIDSPRERLIAILTNVFMPCNGRFPALLSVIAMFFTAALPGAFGTLVSALALLAVILLGVAVTLLVSLILSRTLLKGKPSAFALELPPYRMPQFGRVLVRSLFDRTLFVLGRAVTVAAPAGILIWCLANIPAGGLSLLSHLAGALDGFGRFLGMDGVILCGFLLAFPANEIALPLMIMTYSSGSVLTAAGSSTEMYAILSSNGWTWKTALCVVVFLLLHWPCSTTLLTVKKETGSLAWTAAAFLIPTLTGILLCAFLQLALP